LPVAGPTCVVTGATARRNVRVKMFTEMPLVLMWSSKQLVDRGVGKRKSAAMNSFGLYLNRRKMSAMMGTIMIGRHGA